MRFVDENGFSLVDHDFATGRTTWQGTDAEGRSVFRIDQPVDDIIRANHEQTTVAGTGWKGDYHQVASVPLNVAWDSGLVEAVTQQDDKFVARYLNDGDNRAWRTKEGRI